MKRRSSLRFDLASRLLIDSRSVLSAGGRRHISYIKEHSGGAPLRERTLVELMSGN